MQLSGIRLGLRTSHANERLTVEQFHDASTTNILSCQSLTIVMGKNLKRQALEDELFSRHTKKFKNPLVQQANFYHVGVSGVHVNTTTTGRHSLPKRSESPVKPTPLHDVAIKQDPEDEGKKQTQVSLVTH
jgi:hypothetical protein